MQPEHVLCNMLMYSVLFGELGHGPRFSIFVAPCAHVRREAEIEINKLKRYGNIFTDTGVGH